MSGGVRDPEALDSQTSLMRSREVMERIADIRKINGSSVGLILPPPDYSDYLNEEDAPGVHSLFDDDEPADSDRDTDPGFYPEDICWAEPEPSRMGVPGDDVDSLEFQDTIVPPAEDTVRGTMGNVEDWWDQDN